METSTTIKGLETKPDYERCIERIYAWYEQEIIDRPPVRFHRHNAQFEGIETDAARWASQREKWFDADYQLEAFEKSLEISRFTAETFPVYMPNLGPDIYAAYYGVELEFGETTSWSHEILNEWSMLDDIFLNRESVYYKGIEELTRRALESCANRYWVGYTDLHPGMDCASALRGNAQLCMDLYDAPEQVHKLLDLSIREFPGVFDTYHELLRSHGQPSVSWMNIPSYGKFHIPSNDFSAMISSEQFEEFCLPIHTREIAGMTHNVFHVDGPGVARHIDYLLELDEIHGIQWVQGVGEDYPILQWVELIRKVQGAGKGIIVDLAPEDLDQFMDAVSPEGIFLWINAETAAEEESILQRLMRWR